MQLLALEQRISTPEIDRNCRLEKKNPQELENNLFAVLEKAQDNLLFNEEIQRAIDQVKGISDDSLVAKLDKAKKDGLKSRIEKAIKEKANKLALAIEETYKKLSESYKAFHREYMKENRAQAYDRYIPEEQKEKDFKWGDEVISYEERKEVARKIQMNAMMGGGHNHIDPRKKEDYEFAKLDKFFLMQSFMRYEHPFT
jgi:hypothetical protein